MEDSKIIELLFARDEKAISEIDAQYGRLLYSIAFNVLGDHEDCEECVNDTYLKAWNSIPPAKPKYFSAYLGRIVRNQAINLWHYNRAKKRYHPADLMLDELLEIIPDEETAADIIDAKELAGHISTWLRSLEQEERVLFLRRYWYGKAVKDLAVEFNTTANILTGRLYRLRQKLNKSLAEKGFTL